MSERVSFLETLARENPRGAAKYMVHLARQIQGLGGHEGAIGQIITTKISGNTQALEVARTHYSDLRGKFMAIAEPFFDEHMVLGSYVDGLGGEAREIFDIMEMPEAWS